ncbi:MAG: NUDIX hydrolase [Thermoplasmatota archaeon]
MHVATQAGPVFARFRHESAPVNLRMQTFVIVRDAARKVALLRLEDQPELWRLPGESMLLNESPAEAAARVASLWFSTPLAPHLVDVQSYPSGGGEHDHWYLLFIYEARAPQNLRGTPDTKEISFVAPGKAPGPMFGDHESVLARLPP